MREAGREKTNIPRTIEPKASKPSTKMIPSIELPQLPCSWFELSSGGFSGSFASFPGIFSLSVLISLLSVRPDTQPRKLRLPILDNNSCKDLFFMRPLPLGCLVTMLITNKAPIRPAMSAMIMGLRIN